MQYFTFDAMDSLYEHGASLNKITQNRGEHIKATYLQRISNELKEVNLLVQECEHIGHTLSNIGQAQSVTTVVAELNTRTSAFDVAAVTSDRTTGDRTLTYKLKGNFKATTIPTSHHLLEPLSYPILFPFGEDGWGQHTNRDLNFADYLLSRMLMPDKNHSGELLL